MARGNAIIPTIGTHHKYHEHIMSSGGNGDNQGAWLGLLKWSLAYTDGTRPSSETMQMSEEDKKFLEMVMKEGIIDEGERMKTILNDLAGSLDRMVKEAAAAGSTTSSSEEEIKGEPEEEEKTDTPELSEDDMVGLLEELRDIVEQIDYAKAFAALGGVPFLVGCASERGVVPKPVRSSCIAVLATLTQNNPHVQDIVLKSGALQTLADLFFAETPKGKEFVGDSSAGGGDAEMTEPDVDGTLRSKIVQAMSCSVRGHVEGERAFCASDGGRQVIECGLGLLSGSDDDKDDGMLIPPPVLRRRTLFFLQALITSDEATKERIELFNPCIQYICTDMLSAETESDAEVRETGLGMLQRMIEQNNNVNMIAACKNAVVGVGIKRVSEIRKMEGEDKEFASYELELWESLIVQLARL